MQSAEDSKNNNGEGNLNGYGFGGLLLTSFHTVNKWVVYYFIMYPKYE